MKKLFILMLFSFFLTACAGLMKPTPELDQSLEELLEQAEGAGFDSAYTGAQVEAAIAAHIGRNLTVGDPGSDAELTTEQAQREAFNLKEDADAAISKTDEAETLTANWVNTTNPWADNEVADDITLTNLSQITTKPITGLSATNWRIFYSADGAIPVELALGADGTFLESNGAAAAPGFRALAAGDIPDISATYENADVAIVKSDEAETITANWANTANPWADNEVANSLTLDLFLMSVLTAAPGSPAAGVIYYADNDTWDPADIAGTDNYYCIYDGAAYIAIIDEDGAFFISSIELPSYTHFATGDATYNDTSTPHVLIAAEIKNGIITNAGATEDRVYTCPAAEFGINFRVQVIAAYQMDIEPDGTETLWLNGTQMAAGEHIINAADTKGDVMACWSVESGDGTYEIFCKSDNANFAEATP